MQLNVRHVTRYTYAEPARGIIQLLRATPASFTGQNVLDWRIDVDSDARLREGRDGYGNITHMLYVDKPVRGLSVSVTGRVLTEDRAGIVMGLPHDLPPQIFCRSTPLTEAGPAIEALARSIENGPDPALGRLHNLNARLHQAMTFDTKATDSETSAEQAAAAGLLNLDRDRQGLCAAAIAGAAHRRRAEIIQAGRHPHVRVGRANAVGRVEGDPAERIEMDLRPCVPGVLPGDAVGAVEVAADIASRNAEMARAGDEDMAQVLADAALERESLGGGRAGICRVGIEGDFAVQGGKERVHQRKLVLVAVGARRFGESEEGGIRFGKSRFAQVKTRRKSFDAAGDDTASVGRFDDALYADRELFERSFGGEGMGQVAEGILVLVQQAIVRTLDPPGDDVLAVMIARRQPQNLRHAERRAFVAIGRGVRDMDSHDEAGAS